MRKNATAEYLTVCVPDFVCPGYWVTLKCHSHTLLNICRLNGQPSVKIETSQSTLKGSWDDPDIRQSAHTTTMDTLRTHVGEP